MDQKLNKSIPSNVFDFEVYVTKAALMSSTKTKKKLSAELTPTKKATTNSSDESSDEIMSGMSGLTTEGKHFSFEMFDPWKTHLYLKKDQQDDVLGKVFVNSCPKTW